MFQQSTGKYSMRQKYHNVLGEDNEKEVGVSSGMRSIGYIYLTIIFCL